MDGKAQVFQKMAGVGQRVTVCAVVILVAGATEYGAKQHHGIRLIGVRRADGCGHRPQQVKAVLVRIVVVQTGRQPIHATRDDIQFAGKKRSGRWGCPQCVAAATQRHAGGQRLPECQLAWPALFEVDALCIRIRFEGRRRVAPRDTWRALEHAAT